jgi:hypothetical protein
MESLRRYATSATVGAAVLAVGSLVVAVTEAFPADFTPGVVRGWWLAIAIGYAAAGIGMVLRQQWGWFLALFVTTWMVLPTGVVSLIGGEYVGTVLYLVLGAVMLTLLMRASGYFPGSRVYEAEHGTLPAPTGVGFNPPLDATP